MARSETGVDRRGSTPPAKLRSDIQPSGFFRSAPAVHCVPQLPGMAAFGLCGLLLLHFQWRNRNFFQWRCRRNVAAERSQERGRGMTKPAVPRFGNICEVKWTHVLLPNSSECKTSSVRPLITKTKSGFVTSRFGHQATAPHLSLESCKSLRMTGKK